MRLRSWHGQLWSPWAISVSTQGSALTLTHLGRWQNLWTTDACSSHVGTGNMKWPLDSELTGGLLGEVGLMRCWMDVLLERSFQMSNVAASCKRKTYSTLNDLIYVHLLNNGSQPIFHPTMLQTKSKCKCLRWGLRWSLRGEALVAKICGK